MPPLFTVRESVAGQALTSGLMLDDPIVRKVIHGHQRGGIVVDPVSGACVGILDWRTVLKSFKDQTEVGVCSPGWDDPLRSYQEGHSVADAMQPMTQPRSHEFGGSRMGGISYYTGHYRQCIACGCNQMSTRYSYDSVPPICFGPR